MAFIWNWLQEKSGEANTWSIGEVTPEVAIKGFGGAAFITRHVQPKQQNH